MVNDFAKCPHCGKDAARDTLGRPMRLCGSEDCRRKAAAARSRKARAKRREEQNTRPVENDGPELFQAPWGRTYPDEGHAWAAGLLTGWVEDDGYRPTSAEQAEWLRMMSERRDGTSAA